MSLSDQLLFLRCVGSVNVRISHGTYTMWAVRGSPKPTVIEVSGSTFEEAAQKLIERFGS